MPEFYKTAAILYILTFFLPTVAWGGSSSLRACLRPQLADLRQVSASCRAALKTEDGVSLCFSASQWKQWLEAKNGGPDCGTWRGQWRSWSPPENLGKEKLVFTRFHVTDFPNEGQSRFMNGAFRAIDRIRENSSSFLSAWDSLGFFRFLLLNETNPRTPGHLLRLLGFVHLLTATGIHLYALAGLWKSLGRSIGSLLGVPTRMTVPVVRIWSSVMWFYAWALAGARLGMLRPLIIVLARKTAEWIGFRWSKWTPLGAALFFEMIVSWFRSSQTGNSHALLEGRLYYALAVGGGLLISDSLRTESFLKKQIAHFRLAIASWVLVAVWEIAKDGMIAPLTPVLSFLTVPVFCVFLYPLLLTFSLGQSLDLLPSDLSAFPGPWHFFGDIFLSGTQKLFSLPVARVMIMVIDSKVLVPAFALSLLIVFSPALKRSVPVISLLVLIFATRLLLDSEKPPTSSHALARKVEQLDVGQGDAALVLGDDGSAGLIDTGSPFGMSEEGWVRLLAHRGIRRIDWVALTHFDDDHSGGLMKIASLIPIGCVATSKQQSQSEKGQRLADELLRVGLRLETWEEGCLPFPVLGPDPSERARRNAANAFMSVIVVPFRDGGFYVNAGDAIAKDEYRIGMWVSRQPFFRKPGPRILKLSHHGSRSSSDPEFLKQLRPTEAWISAGVGNRYGHPHLEVLQRLSSLKIAVRRTDYQGAILREAGVRHRPRKHPP